MEKELVNKFMKKKQDLEKEFSQKHPDSYTDLVKAVMTILRAEPYEDEEDFPSPDRIHKIDDNPDYQGILLYIIGSDGYAPSYWYVNIDYGSCSGCDTLLAIKGYDDDLPSPQQVKDYMTLALHIVQKLKKMEEYTV